MIQPSPAFSKFTAPSHASASNAGYNDSEIDAIQKQLDFSNEINLKENVQHQQEEKKGYAHSNKRGVHGEHLSYSEMQLSDAPPTAFDGPSATI